MLTASQTGEQLDNVQAHETDCLVTDLQWAPDRTYFITSSKDKTAKVTTRLISISLTTNIPR
jgi:translation initiation factor 3 subunit I